MGILQNMVKLFQFVRFQTKLALLPCQSILGGKTHYDLFPVDCRQNGNTDIKLLSVHNPGDTAVLRLSLLGDIHAADDLDTRYNRRQKPYTVNGFLIEGAVDTVTDAHLSLHRFDMDIGSALSDRLVNHAFDKLHNGGIVDILTVHILLLNHLAFFFPGVLLQRGIYFRLPVIMIYCQHYAAHGGNHRLHLQVRDDVDIIHRRDIHRIRHGHPEHIHVIRRIFERNRPVFLQNARRHEIQNFLRNDCVLQIHHIVVELFTQRPCDILLGSYAFIHQCLAQFTPTALLTLQPPLQIFLRNNTVLYKHVSKT